MSTIQSNSKIGIGILGVGNIAELCSKGYLQDDRCKVVAVCDVNEDKAKRKAEKWGIKQVYTDIDEFLNDSSIDAVEILTPTHMHKNHVAAAASAKKHISCQKPIATSIPDSIDMIQAAREVDVTFRINECFYHFPPLVEARNLIQQGKIGIPQQIRIHTLVGQTDSDFQVGMDPDGYGWRFSDASPGGHIFDDMVHKIAISQWLVGQKIVSLKSSVRRQHTFFEPFVSLLEYEDGNLLGILDSVYGHNLWMNSSYYGADEFVEITGDEGFIWVTRCTGELLDFPPLSIFEGDKDKRAFKHIDTINADWGAGFELSSKHFLDSLIDESILPEMTPDDATNVLQICFGIYQAAVTGNSVDPRTIDNFVISPGGYP